MLLSLQDHNNHNYFNKSYQYSVHKDECLHFDTNVYDDFSKAVQTLNDIHSNMNETSIPDNAFTNCTSQAHEIKYMRSLLIVL